MTNLLNRSTINNLENLTQQFSENKPFKHVYIDNFFTPEFCQSILDDFPEFDEKLALNENGTVGKKSVHEHISEISDNYNLLDTLVKSENFIHLIEKITGIKGLIYDPYYFGGGTHDNLNGQDLDPHVDFTHHPKTGYHRRLNLIVYLNHEWEKSWGGNIELHKNPRLEPQLDEIVSIEPLFNRAVIFETHNSSWHGFPKINLPDDKKQLSRKSFALYYYTKTRNKQNKTHATIYVDRHLPERIKAGVTLSENDVQEIKTLLIRRDQHLERLYGYITGLTAKTAEIKYKVLRRFAKYFIK
ncbi:MAG: 2OG-Fe(II) oxygenase [Proteobacteria bacterium]|nr:2OG-Fe(II) oxygenase [Pseudomonadota bacterium]